MYKDFIHIFVLSCTKATYLLEKKFHARLSFIEKLQLKLHFKLCSYCSCYEKKAELLDRLAKISIDDPITTTIFSAEEIDCFKNRVHNKINS